MQYFELDISSDGWRDEVGLPAVLVHIVSGLETSLGTLSRDIVNPSCPCRGQARPSTCWDQLKTSLAALATEPFIQASRKFFHISAHL